MLTRSMVAKLTTASASECLFADFLSKIKPKKVSEALKHPGWVDAMQKELNQFYRNNVWTLDPLPYGKTAIGSIWVFKNKKLSMVLLPKTKQDWLHKDDKGISIFQDQYTRNLLKKYEISDSSLVKTPMVPPNNLVLCEKYQSNPNESHLTVVKRILKYLKEKAPQVPVKYLVENWFVGVPRNSSRWLCPQLRDHILKEDIELHFIPTEYQLADIFTKPLD
ncbi:hypothetical protein Tco_0876118 [Tanacetum coccineum]|uniref:Reverse transcriptase n=1 Tax=Tanacetum coccineum TaxID=301880 RepID=A0ABQ5BUA5_9ASTR